MPSNNSAEQATEIRRLKAWDLRVQGKTYREIGDALGVSHVTAWDDVKQVSERMRSELSESAEHHRSIQLQRLDKAISVLMPMLDDPDRALEAMDRLDKLEKRRAALLGLDSPAKQELSGPAGGAIAIDARTALIEKLSCLVTGGAPEAGPAADPSEPDAG